MRNSKLLSIERYRRRSSLQSVSSPPSATGLSIQIDNGVSPFRSFGEGPRPWDPLALGTYFLGTASSSTSPAIETRATNGRGVSRSMLSILRSAFTYAFAMSSPLSPADASTKAAPRASMIWAISVCRVRTCRSFVKIAQPWRPTSASQSRSGVPGWKWSAWISTRTPRSRRAVGTLRLPSDSSTKKTAGSGGDSGGELPPERFLDVFRRPTVLLRQLVDGLAGLPPLGKHACGDTSSDQSRSSEADRGVDHHRLGAVQVPLSRKREEPSGKAFRISLHAKKVLLEHLAQRSLPVLRGVDQLCVVLDEQVESVRKKVDLCQRPTVVRKLAPPRNRSAFLTCGNGT